MSRRSIGLLLGAVAMTAPPALGAADEGEGDRSRAMAEGIEGMLDFYVVKPDRRDPLETVVVDGNMAEIWFLDPVDARRAEQARCNAYRWLMLGRLNRSKDIRAVFQAYPDLEEVKVVFFEVKTRIEPDGKRGYRQFRKTAPRIELTLTRATALNLNIPALRSKLAGPGCVREGERVVDRKWYREES